VFIPNYLIKESNITTVQSEVYTNNLINETQIESSVFEESPTTLTTTLTTATKKNSKENACDDRFEFWESLYSALTGSISGSVSCGLIAFLVKLCQFIQRRYFTRANNELIVNV
jgi:hypothetical protein